MKREELRVNPVRRVPTRIRQDRLRARDAIQFPIRREIRLLAHNVQRDKFLLMIELSASYVLQENIAA